MNLSTQSIHLSLRLNRLNKQTPPHTKMISPKQTIWIVLILLGTICSHLSANACSCRSAPTLDQRVTQSEAVIVGRLLKITDPHSSGEAEIRVDRVFKGPLKSDDTIKVPLAGYCSVFRVNDIDKDLILFLNEQNLTKRTLHGEPIYAGAVAKLAQTDISTTTC